MNEALENILVLMSSLFIIGVAFRIIRLAKTRRYFEDTKYDNIIKEAENNWRANHNHPETIQAILDKLPSDETLLAELVEKLKGKSIYKALRRANEGKEDWAALKAVSSLLTHTVISCQQGETQYRKLIPKMLERINDLSYRLIK